MIMLAGRENNTQTNPREGITGPAFFSEFLRLASSIALSTVQRVLEYSNEMNSTQTSVVNTKIRLFESYGLSISIWIRNVTMTFVSRAVFLMVREGRTVLSLSLSVGGAQSDCRLNIIFFSQVAFCSNSSPSPPCSPGNQSQG